MIKRILFVCTGNTCRSPIAEQLFRQKASRLGLELEVQSAGVAAVAGSPVSEQACSVLKDRGIDCTSQRSQMINEELMQWADVVLTMTMSHKYRLTQFYPDAVDRIYTVKEFAFNDEETMKLRQEVEKLAGEMQIKLALSEQISEEDRRRWAELEQRLPDDDVSDPFGGSKEVYEATAQELDDYIGRILDRLQQERASEED